VSARHPDCSGCHSEHVKDLLYLGRFFTCSERPDFQPQQ
jgi:hypothetical protein